MGAYNMVMVSLNDHCSLLLQVIAAFNNISVHELFALNMISVIGSNGYSMPNDEENEESETSTLLPSTPDRHGHVHC